MLEDLRGIVVLVTGGSTGIGAAVAKESIKKSGVPRSPDET